jgi:hypothetical protein
MPLYLLGHEMLSWYPYVPIGGEMGTNWAILSYNGKAYFGFTCDVGAVPDPENLEKFVDESFAELCKSVKRVKTPAALDRDERSPEPRTEPARRERSRMIPLGEPVPPRAKPKKRTSKSKATSKPTPAAKPEVPLASGNLKPPQSHTVGEASAASGSTAENAAQAVVA